MHSLLRRIDYLLFFPAVLLAVLGSVILSSISVSSYPEHFVFLIVALIVFVIFSNIDSDLFQRSGWIFYGISILMLVLTLVLGSTLRGATRWISIGPVTVQTSEIVKPLLVIFCGSFLANKKGNLKFLQLGLFMFIPVALVYVQPDLGSSIIVACVFTGAVVLGGLSIKLILALLGCLLLLIPLILNYLQQYQIDRITAFLNPESDPLGIGYNSIQAMIAIGSGQLFGRGLGQGTQSQLSFLPESHTDFIFSALSEELGFFGALLVLMSFVVIFLRLGYLVLKTEKTFVQTVIGSVFFVIFIQATVNIGMNMGVLPITGIPLPFVSAGGSSLFAMSALLGIASSISFSLKESRFSGIL